ncbi:MAG: hypothetical protein QXJ07_05260 [Candidatus Bathyarchaeia archaeon]
MPTPFKALAELCEKLEATNKRTLMVNLVADFLEKLEPSEVEPAISMLLVGLSQRGVNRFLR